MPTIGKLEQYNEKAEDWCSYIERLEMYFKANDVSDEKKVPVLISSMGPSTYALLKDLLAPALPSTKTSYVES